MSALYERIQELASSPEIEVRSVPDFPAWCQLIVPSRITPSRMMPPLMLETAERILNDQKVARESDRGRDDGPLSPLSAQGTTSGCVRGSREVSDG
jgi:hypothetical protein